MAIKKQKKVVDNRSQLDLVTLSQYVQLINDKASYVPGSNELIQLCDDIVANLARTPLGESDKRHYLTLIEEFFVGLANSVSSDFIEKIVHAVLTKVFTIIINEGNDASPSLSVVFAMFDTNRCDIYHAAQWLVRQVKNHYPENDLHAVLSCMYRWIEQWPASSSMGCFVYTFINALEENGYFDLLMEVSLEHIVALFTCLMVEIRQSVAHVIFHVLASMRQSLPAFDQIHCHVREVLAHLAAESSQWSRQILQNVVVILTSTLYHLNDLHHANMDFKQKYADVNDCLQRHMNSVSSEYLSKKPWVNMRATVINSSKTTFIKKAGLMNLGNTCYINSVTQALLATRLFSNNLITQRRTGEAWMIMADLFAKMLYSHSFCLDPNAFVAVVRPPSFLLNQQHDSSEFLGYLLQLLKSQEQMGFGGNLKLNNKLTPNTRSFTRSLSWEPSDSETSNRPCTSPGPGSSTGTSSSYKRLSTLPDSSVVPKKRMKFSELQSQSYRKESLIDSMFGGLLATKVKCEGCHNISLSTDAFHDLQLSFPEKPECDKLSVQALLDYYCTVERLCGDNKYKCSNCNGLNEADRSTWIAKPPKHLILVLKNFRYDSKRQENIKLMHRMHYDMDVEISCDAQTKCGYHLYATVIHSGNALDSGHYYTLAEDNGVWNSFDDSAVVTKTEKEINTLHLQCTPYILFYRRFDIEKVPVPNLHELPEKLQDSVLAYNKYVTRI